MIPDGVDYNGGVGHKNCPCHECPSKYGKDGRSCINYSICEYWRWWFMRSWDCFNRYAQKQAEIHERMQGGTGT